MVKARPKRVSEIYMFSSVVCIVLLVMKERLCMILILNLLNVIPSVLLHDHNPCLVQGQSVLEAHQNSTVEVFGRWQTELYMAPPVVNVSGKRVSLSLSLYIFCLLYTSPSPRDATLSRMPSSA